MTGCPCVVRYGDLTAQRSRNPTSARSGCAAAPICYDDTTRHSEKPQGHSPCVHMKEPLPVVMFAFGCHSRENGNSEGRRDAVFACIS